MRNFRPFSLVLVAALALAGCGTIETGNVGVRTAWDGEINPQEENPGFYTAFFDDVEEFQAREIAVELRDLTPKAADNLSLSELDFDIYYTVNDSSIADLSIKYAARHEYARGGTLPAYHLVFAYARSAAYEVTSQYESLELHQHRDTFAQQVREQVQAALDASDPGVFTITKIIVRDVKTDPSVEEAIRMAVAKNKELEAKRLQVQIAEQEAEANRILNESLTASILRNRELDVLQQMASQGNVSPIVIMGSGDNAPDLILPMQK